MSMNTLKQSKVFSLLLVCIMAVSLCIGCTKKTVEEPAEVVTEPVEDISDTTDEEPVDVVEEDVVEEVVEEKISLHVTGDMELDRAVSIGITSAEQLENMDRTATAEETAMTALNLAELFGSDTKDDLLPFLSNALENHDGIDRFAGMTIIYLTARSISDDFANEIDWECFGEMIADPDNHDFEGNIIWRGDLFGSPDSYGDCLVSPTGDHLPVMPSIYNYSLGRKDCYSQKSIFEFDEEAVSINPQLDLSYEDMIRAMVRLYDSDPDMDDSMDHFAELYCSEEGIPTKWTYFGVSDYELEKANKYGLMPDEWKEKYWKPVSYSEYAGLLTKAVEIWSPDKVEEWNDIMSLALESDETMNLEHAYIMLTYLLNMEGKTVLEKERIEFPSPWINKSQEEKDKYYGELSWGSGYPYFKNWEEIAYKDVYMTDFVASTLIFANQVSPVSDKYILPYDEANDTLHLGDKLRRDVAVCALLRLLEKQRVELDPEWGKYVNVADAGKADTSILSKEVLSIDSNLPEVTQDKLPADWHGVGLSSNKMFVEEYLHLKETDIALLSQNGFNFSKFFLNFASLRYPDYPEDPYLVNENELKELDSLISWGIKYDVHIQISMIQYMDINGNAPKNAFNETAVSSFPLDDERWELIKAYWTMLAERYKDVPTKNLTFDLCNEVQPDKEEQYEYGKTKLKELTDAIRAIDPDRVLLYSQASLPNPKWTRIIAECGLAVGCHPYVPETITSMSYNYFENNEYADVYWPMPLFPQQKAMRGDEPIIFKGEIGGKKLSFHVENYTGYSFDPGSKVIISADDTQIASLTVNSTDASKLYSADIPTGTKEVKVQIDGFVYIDTFIFESDGFECKIIPHDNGYERRWLEKEETPLLPIIINSDGSYKNSAGTVTDEDYIYNRAIKPYRDIADEYGVGFMINECGMYGVRVNWDIDTVVAYHDILLNCMEKNNLGWCYCEAYNIFPKHIVILYGDEAAWEGATVEIVPVTDKSGNTWTYKIDKELLEVLSKHAKQ